MGYYKYTLLFKRIINLKNVYNKIKKEEFR